jgi:ABC-type multidrug transport system fused ATPase/permease subunit
MNYYKKINYLLSPYHKKELIIISILLIFGVLLEMMSLGILVPLINFLTDDKSVKKFQIEYNLYNISYSNLIILSMLFLFIIYLIKTFFLIYLSWRQSKFSSLLYSDISSNLFNNYLTRPYIFHTLRNSSELMKNIQIEVDVFSYVSRSAMVMASEISFIIGITSLLIYFNPIGTTVVIIFFGFATFTFHKFTKKRLLKWGIERQKCDEKSYKHLSQAFNGIKDVILLSKSNFFLNNFNYFNSKKSNIIAKQNTLQLIPRMYLELLAILALSLLVGISVYQNNRIDKILPIVTIFVAAAFRLIPSLNKIMGTMQTFRYANPVINLLYKEFIDTKSFKSSNVENKKINFEKNININNVSFTFPESDRFSLNNITFTINKGESIGLIGSSGSGKSTLVDIIMGILNPDKGLILSDDVSISENLNSWQKKIGYVPQNIFLLDDSLKANIAFGIELNKIDNDKVLNALKIAELDEWVEDLPDNINTFVGEKGVRLSGGQIQRIGIARALYHDPDILILDEATSSLDSITESKIMKSVNSLHGIKTLIIIAHRLSTVQKCDIIYKLDKGNIIDYGEPSKFI